MITFTANYIAPASILKRIDNGTYSPIPVSVAQIDYNNKNDIKVLSELSKKWQNNYFCSTVSEIAASNPSKSTKIFIITKQKQSEISKKINSDDILGFSYVRYSKYKTNLLYLESIPQKIKDKEFKGIGTAMIEYLKSETNIIRLHCFAVNTIRNFYKKLGFRSLHPNDKKTS